MKTTPAILFTLLLSTTPVFAADLDAAAGILITERHSLGRSLQGMVARKQPMYQSNYNAQILGLDQSAPIAEKVKPSDRPCEDAKLASPSEASAALEDSLKAISAQCIAILGRFEYQAAQSKERMETIAIIGLIAGSVVAPALLAKTVVAKSTVAAWSGLAGATNGAQHVLADFGDSPKSILEAREKLRAIVAESMKIASNQGAGFCERTAATSALAANCIAYYLTIPTKSTSDVATGVPSTPPKAASEMEMIDKDAKENNKQ